MDAEARIKIRRLTAQDYDAVVAVWREAALAHRPDGRDSRDAFSREAARMTSMGLGAWSECVLVGVVLGTHDGRKGWVNRLAVLPQYRRRGIGRMLIEELERRVHQKGIKMTACLIEGENNGSKAFFQSVGYAEQPRISYYTKRSSMEW